MVDNGIDSSGQSSENRSVNVAHRVSLKTNQKYVMPISSKANEHKDTGSI